MSWTRLTIAIALSFGAAGCDFFKELEGNESETGEESSSETAGESTGETGEESCMLGVNDACIAQDLVLTCEQDSDEFVTFDCAAACSPNLNVSCITVSGVQGCWCAAPGPNKLDSCSELEDCLDGCGAQAYESCGDTCFARTDSQTVRLLGALIYCAEQSCETICGQDPGAACGNCLWDARQGLIGDCALERSICDQDSNGDPWP